MQEQLKNDEKDWDHEYADIPSVSQITSIVSNESVSRPNGKFANISDFPGYSCVSNSYSSTDFSIGRFFSNRCVELQDVLPAKSPTKSNYKPMSLIPPNSTQSQIGWY